MGGSGDDHLCGGKGDDHLLGDPGQGTYVIASGEGEDLLIDFVSGEDKLAFVRDSFDFSPAAVSDVVTIGGEAPTDGAAIHIAAGKAPSPFATLRWQAATVSRSRTSENSTMVKVFGR